MIHHQSDQTFHLIALSDFRGPLLYLARGPVHDRRTCRLLVEQPLGAYMFAHLIAEVVHAGEESSHHNDP